ncbi:4-oxalocrotonate tautomerase family protein [Streptomyces sp. NPDC091292]|uniref:tautomerase family protein n=1 Tax=Streptomyces sp. NPDC091292 TaxID=3365991 RepID=UPI003812BC69
MPHFTVQIREEEFDGKVEPRLIAGLTEAVAHVFGEWARSVAVVTLVGVPRGRWGSGGVPSDENAPVVVLGMREGAFALPDVPDAPARLIATITDAVTDVFGEQVRERVTVLLEAVPEGRSGVGGVPV